MKIDEIDENLDENAGSGVTPMLNRQHEFAFLVSLSGRCSLMRPKWFGRRSL
jgi:hypothetical protein